MSSTTSLTSTSLSFQAFCGRIVCRGVMENQVRDVPAGDRGYRLLVQRLERHDAEVDLVAAGLLVVGDRLAESGVLLAGRSPAPARRSRSRRPHWRYRAVPGLPLPPDPTIRELPNAGSCCSWPFSFPDVRTRSFRYLGDGCFERLLDFKRMATCGTRSNDRCPRRRHGCGVGRKKEGFHTDGHREPHGAPPRGLNALRAKWPAPSSVGPPCWFSVLSV